MLLVGKVNKMVSSNSRRDSILVRFVADHFFLAKIGVHESFFFLLENCSAVEMEQNLPGYLVLDVGSIPLKTEEPMDKL